MSLDRQLPDSPARRLVMESTVAWGLRHPDEEYLDYKEAPWSTIQRLVLNFLRHQLTDYDEKLRIHCERDKAYRDQLAAEVTQAAFRKYPWLAQDPRPFPKSDNGRYLDYTAKYLSTLHSLRAQLMSAIGDFRRRGNHRDQIAVLQQELAEINAEIDVFYLTAAKTSSDSEGELTRALTFPRPNGTEYDFFTSRVEPPSYLLYAGFCCPRCHAAVMQRKGFVDIGQGYNRIVAWSCHCLTHLVHKPPQSRLAPVTIDYWEKAAEAPAEPIGLL